jgi:NAD(P)-dependent dehydrogenase (short-subunit alcohol dehydrogenase family)
VFTNKYDVTPGSLYSASKAAINMLVAKYSAQYKKDGVLFLALCPGMVEVGHYKDCMIHLLSPHLPSDILC